jgi:seryl-tRNA synthetase
MLDIKWIRDNPKLLAAALEKRGKSPEEAASTVEDLVARDEARRAHLGRLQERQERRNSASKEIGNAMRAGDAGLAESLKAEVGEIKTFLAGAEALERDLDKALDDALAVLPNIPLDDVPVGRDEHDNVVARQWGTVQPRPNWAKEHFEIGEAMGFMDFERAAKMSGARFTILKGQLARLERALGQFMLDLHTTEHGYTEVQPPLMVNDGAMFGTGQLPKFKEDLFAIHTDLDDLAQEIIADTREVRTRTEYLHRVDGFFTSLYGRLGFEDRTVSGVVDLYKKTLLESAEADSEKMNSELQKVMERHSELKRGGTQDRFLIPTAEVPLTNLVREEILDAKSLPLRYTALTPCFRSEAGSAGRDTRGMLRQHQFYKVELVSITDQENSVAEHERMTACAEEVLKRLELPFRTMTLCTGDMGFGARKTYDLEVWLPGQHAYREISSCSVCGDFQARRMDARYKVQGEKATRFVHTLNGSGVAVGRALIAVMENYQNEDGSVTIPQVLRPYMGGLEKIGN